MTILNTDSKLLKFFIALVVVYLGMFWVSIRDLRPNGRYQLTTAGGYILVLDSRTGEVKQTRLFDDGSKVIEYELGWKAVGVNPATDQALADILREAHKNGTKGK